MNKKLEKAYVSQDVAVLPGELSDAFKKALCNHWNGHYLEALKYYEFVDFKLLSLYEQELAEADQLLIQVKMGKSLDLKKAKKFKNKVPQIIFHYARYTWAFWVDHRISWNSLIRLFLSSIRSPFEGQAPMSVFLMGHMWAIAGKTRIGFFLASTMHRWALKKELTNRPYSRLAANIVYAAFPYTLVISGHLGKSFTHSVIAGEKFLSREPYFVSLFQISSLYGYAYTADVSRAEIYSNQLLEIHKKQGLLRYKPLSKIMPLLPFALRGYGHLIQEDLGVLLDEHKPENSDPLVNSQFYRVASVISLVLMRQKEALRLSKLANQYREETKSFVAWKAFDQHIEFLARRAEPFNPQKDRLLIANTNFLTPPNLGDFFVQALNLLVRKGSSTKEEFSQNLAKLIIQHFDCTDYTLTEEVPGFLDEMPWIKVGDYYLGLQGSASERSEYLREMLAHTSPIIVTVFRMYEEQIKNRKLEKMVALADLAAQVAHDIRSPLSALEMATFDLDDTQLEAAPIMKQAVGRIKDIANNLITENRKALNQGSSDENEVASLELISSIADDIVSEKRAQYSNIPDIKIVSKYEINARSKFSKVVKSKFLRALSNLIDNSVQACSNSGTIQVRLRATPTQIKIEVEDDGCGIPTHALQRLGEKGFTHGKKDGNGLGLYSVRNFLEESAGSLLVKSDENQGTIITLSLPLSTPPKWFQTNLDLHFYNSIYVIDDDESVHQMWKSRLEQIGTAAKHFMSGGSFLEKTDLSKISYKDLILIDYELIKGQGSGLELLKNSEVLNKSHCILVTSHFDNKEIQSECLKLGVRIIPKSLIGFTPLQKEEKPVANRQLLNVGDHPQESL